MGILDDAIREHLELKRQHGAEVDDLERLENEAFGAPARPGDPEFAEEGAALPGAAAEADTGAEQLPVSEAPPLPAAPDGNTDDWLADEGETTVAPEVPSSPAEHARAEHAHLDDTADHPAPEPGSEEVVSDAPPVLEEEPAAPPEPVAEAPPAPTEPLPPEPEPVAEAEPAPEPAEEAEPPEAPESGIFDAAEEFEFDELDLELDEEDDGTVGPQPAATEPAAPEPPSAPPSEPLPPEPATEVQRAPYVEDDTDNPPLPVQRPATAEDEEEDEEGKGEEDVLEETPDFLRETPEGEDLWFEQGPPKDFDFDDDD